MSATPRALQAGDMDTSVPAVCGQISAVETIAFNAREAHQRGELSDEGYQSRLEAARYVYAHLPTNNAIAAAVIKLQSWLSDHPTTAGALALDPDDSGLQDAIGAVTKSCGDAGSPIGVSAAYGG
ncbi:hypothetical protein [Curtobacterium sp. 20TX0008]|uniref:hypothetical protein n=1 Tax=Curtobacterium sp. 20TX0008 TaxID=3022018 RepID=UPI00232DB991|nr:hypothetical protein [Curtobacterium sp. 20TX0008]MDB6427105.1 hypothetical protein [Curtobacterium sp. 20TX0008]